MRRFILLFAAVALLASGMQAQDCSELFFSEYLEGSGNNKGMEIYNPTDGIINLGSYYVARYSNGFNTYTDGGITQLEGFIQAYGTHLLVNGQTSSTETSPASDPNLRALAQQLDHDYPAPTYMNGNDAIALFKDTGGSGNVADFVLVDLFGIIGGGMPSDGEGWASKSDVWFYKNTYDADGNITGKDSSFISNFIVPDGYYFYSYDLWSANHSLVRKRSVTKGVSVETMPTIEFDVTLEWDTVPGGIDVWDSLNAHYCNCQYGTAVEPEKLASSLRIYPNPAYNNVSVEADAGIEEIMLYDLTGKIILSAREVQKASFYKLDLQAVRNGIYFLKVKTTKDTYTRKLIRQ